MKNFVLKGFVVLVLTSGCSTVEQVCQKQIEEYGGDFQTCVRDNYAKRQAAGDAMVQYSKSLQQPKGRNCTSTPNIFGGYDMNCD